MRPPSLLLETHLYRYAFPCASITHKISGRRHALWAFGEERRRQAGSGLEKAVAAVMSGILFKNIAFGWVGGVELWHFVLCGGGWGSLLPMNLLPMGGSAIAL